MHNNSRRINREWYGLTSDDDADDSDCMGVCCDCELWVKYSLFIINFLVWIAGSCFIGVGVWARLEKQDLGSFDHIITDPAFLMIVIGTVMFVISIFGCIGALRENVCLLKTFCIILSAVFIAELTCGILAFFFIDQIQEGLVDYFKQAIANYQEDADLRNAIDTIQEQYECCGGTDYNDWDVNIYFNCSSSVYTVSKCGVPWSCCKKQPDQVLKNVQCGYGARESGMFSARYTIFTSGCINNLMVLFKDNLFIIGIIAFCIGFIELFAILLAYNMIKNVFRAQVLYRQEQLAQMTEDSEGNVSL